MFLLRVQILYLTFYIKFSILTFCAWEYTVPIGSSHLKHQVQEHSDQQMLTSGNGSIQNVHDIYPVRGSSSDLTIVIGAMYSAIFFVGLNNCQTVQPVVATERTVFYRERAAGMYSSLPYAMAQVFVEIPYVFAQCTYYSVIVYAMVSFEWTAAKFFWLFFINFFSFLYFTYFGMMTVSITPNDQIAAIFAGGFYLLFNIFSGFYIPQPKIPGWWIWYYWICPMAWIVYGCIVSQYHDIDTPISVPGMSPDPAMNWYINDYFVFEMDFMGPVAAVLVGFCVFFAFLYAIFLMALNFQMR